MKKFNITGLCVPDTDYMADISEKLAGIMALVEEGSYFCINRARQYGKTTVLYQLEHKLPAVYTPVSLSFEGLDDTAFENAPMFCKTFLDLCARSFKLSNTPGSDIWAEESVISFNRLNDFLTEVCKKRQYVLIIDEVDKASNNAVFMQFLGVLRDKYLLRKKGKGYTFHSVILAGVYDIKNLKLKIDSSKAHQPGYGESRINSPWNIAVDFDIDMSFNVNEIASMLADYENDTHTGMDINAIAREIRAYTNGYPYLVSEICKTIDSKLNKQWTAKGVENAIKIMLSNKTTLIDDITKNLSGNTELSDMVFSIVALGKKHKYSPIDITADIGLTLGLLIKQGDEVIIANKFFETLLYIYYAKKLDDANKLPIKTTQSEIITEGRLNMPLLIEKFAKHFYELYKDSRKSFIEDECRMLFITYLQPLINGVGFYHIESETRDAKRMDVIVDYGPEQFIIELRLWYGSARHEDALMQLTEYLNRKNTDTGYLLTFDFRKQGNVGEPVMKWTERSGKRIFDVMVGILPP